MFKLVSDRRY